MIKNLAGFLTCAMIFSLTPVPSAANRIYGEAQTDKVSRQSGVGATVNWSTSQSIPTATLFSDSTRFAAAEVALIVPGTRQPDPVSDYLLDFDFSRYLTDSGPPQTPWVPPLIPVEYFDAASNSFVYENLPFDKFQITQASGKFEHAQLKVEKPASYIVKRVAVVAKAKDEDVARFRVRNLTINGPILRDQDKISVVVNIDKRAIDPLLNTATHSK